MLNATKTQNVESFNEAIGYFKYNGVEEVYLNFLPSILKSDIGGILEHEQPDKPRISLVIGCVWPIFNQLKAMAAFTDCDFIKENKRYKHLLRDISELMDDELEFEVWTSIEGWIDEDRTERHDREYAAKKTQVFKDFISVLKECHELATVIDD